jgi:SAM-dependent methyltransferase
MADATALPFADRSADLAWCLGVLCTAPGSAAQRAMLSQLRRVVRPGGRIGLLVYLATVVELDDPPQGNHFPSGDQMRDLLTQAGLEPVEVASLPDVTQPPPDWAEKADTVERELHHRYGHMPQLIVADEQSSLFGRLLSSGQVISQVILGRVAEPDGVRPHR